MEKQLGVVKPIMFCMLMVNLSNLAAQVNFTKSVLTIENKPEFFRLYDLACVDLNNDHLLDLVVSSPDYAGDNDELFWLWNNGQGNFLAIPIDLNIELPEKLVIGDLNNDESPDIVVRSDISNKFSFYINDGVANFSRMDFDIGLFIPKIVDLDQDDDMDLLLLNGLGVYWLVNMGNLIFKFDTIAYTSVNENRSLATVDMDQDQDLDILAATYSDIDQMNRLVFYENNGNEIFTQQILDTQTEPFQDLQVADLDQDYDLDIVVVLLEANQVVWYESLSSITYARHVITSEFRQRPINLALADLDLDGDQDIVVAGGNAGVGQLLYFENDGHAQFNSRIIDNSDGSRNYFSVVDFDNDSDLDLFVPNNFPFEIDFYRNDGIVTSDFNLDNTDFDNFDVYPNPARDGVHLDYMLNNFQHIKIQLYDFYGNKIGDLTDAQLPSDHYDLWWDARHLAPGIYFVKFDGGNYSYVKKMILLP